MLLGYFLKVYIRPLMKKASSPQKIVEFCCDHNKCLIHFENKSRYSSFGLRVLETEILETFDHAIV